MENPWRLDELEIVGYANVLKETMLPSVAPPVFRMRSDRRRVLLPPYSLNGGYVCNASEVAAPELEELRHAREITLFDEPFPARPDYELWVDQSFGYHYQPVEDVEKTLNRIAADSIESAKAALEEGNIQEAERLSGVAISADQRRIEALLIKAAIRRMQGDAAGERLMARLAGPMLAQETFSALTSIYCRSPQRPAQRELVGCARRPMLGMARAAA